MLKNDIISLSTKLWDYHKLTFALKKADYIIGLGSYDIKVAKRCAQLYHEDLAPLIIFCGKHGNWTKAKWPNTEAATFKTQAVNCAVPADKILLEENSENLGENIKQVKDLLIARTPLLKSLIIVTKPNTQRRVFATIQKIWPEIESVITSPQVSFNQQIASDTCSLDLLSNEMVGDVQRMYLYPSMGFQVCRPIPDDVWHSCSILVDAGFDKHLIAPWDTQRLVCQNSSNLQGSAGDNAP